MSIPCGWQQLKIQEITAPGDWEWSAASQQWVPVLVRAWVCYGETRIRRMSFRVGEAVRVIREHPKYPELHLCRLTIAKIFSADAQGKQLLYCDHSPNFGLSIESDFLQPAKDDDSGSYRPLERWKLKDVVTAEMDPQDNPNFVQNPTPQPEATVKESLTVAVESEPVIKDSLTTEEIADTNKTVKQIVAVTDDGGDEALYVDGVLKAWDSTIYSCDIAAIAGNAIVTISHRNVGRTLLDWPKKLSDVFASNDPEIPDSSNPSETPNSSLDNHSADASKMVTDGPTETQQKLDVHETDFANMQNEKITIGYTVPNAYDSDAEPITEPIQRKRVLYIAGPMRGIAWFNYPMFDRVAKELRDAGNEVISPADEDRREDGFDPYANPSHANPDACTFPHEMDFGKTVRRCLDAVLRCDEIVLLPGWENSNGAVAELTLAMWLNKRVRHLTLDDDNRLTFACYWTSLISLAVQLSEHHMPKVERMGLAEQDDEDDEDILDKAARITRGDRQASYGPPDHDFRRTAGMWSALFEAKLKDGVTFEPRDVALAMILLKCSRESHQRKEDNWVDIAGYSRCGSRCN
jgi:hypothetical protein